MIISSVQNPRVKKWLQLLKSNHRRKSATFLVEGIKECIRGLESAYQVDELIICEEIIPDEIKEKILNQAEESPVTYVSKSVYAKIAYRKESEGIIALFRKKDASLQSIIPEKDENPYYIVLENLEKPGNLGAILRTADAVRAKAIILTGSGTDQYNPNVIRASLGTVFSIPVIKCSNEDLANWAFMHSVSLFCAALPAFENLYEMEIPNGATGFVFGAEDKGLTDYWITGEHKNFTIPMHGIADSLNLSVSVAVASYELLRRKSN